MQSAPGEHEQRGPRSATTIWRKFSLPNSTSKSWFFQRSLNDLKGIWREWRSSKAAVVMGKVLYKAQEFNPLTRALRTAFCTPVRMPTWATNSTPRQWSSRWMPHSPGYSTFLQSENHCFKDGKRIIKAQRIRSIHAVIEVQRQVAEAKRYKSFSFRQL